MSKVLYIHGMGGGGDSRIPSILQECFSCCRERDVTVFARTYSFDPETAAGQIASWVEELRPDVVIGESLGALQALRVRGVPLLFVSPALNTPIYFEILSWLVLIPGVTWIFDRIYRPREGDRQKLHFTHKVLRKYMPHRRLALLNTPQTVIHAFFGTRDHYRRSGIVSVRTWKKYFGQTYTMYDGTHYMEEEFVRSLLVETICKILKMRQYNKRVTRK